MDASGDAVAAVRSLIEDVVADYAERTLTAAMPALVEPKVVAKVVADRVIGLGPLQRYFDDPEVEEVWINAPDKVFVARAGRATLTGTVLSEEQVHDLVELMLRPSGRRVDLSTPFVDASLADGSRLHVVIPDVTRRHWAINIRKFVLRANRLEELVFLGTMTRQCARLLEAAVVAGVNLVAAGATQAGKTTLLNCLASAIPPRERLVTCEEVFELQIDLPDVVAMQTRQPNLEGAGEIGQRRLIKEALRMRPNRLIVGEVRQEETLDLLIALNSGIAGMTSLHANSAREALDKLTTLPLLAGENISHRFIVPTVAAAIDLVVFMRCDRDGRRQVEEVLAVPGRVEDGEIESQPLFCRVAGELLWTGHYPPHEERFLAAGIDLGEVLCA
ncbi:MAG TPA: ATPase, T2SS/T4P/T4SS family [Actinomycetes bacterium]|nr:ATPase, T2SS/T4P/T4SS family [Actinomycetes bacterium]